jgi:hypothetical protein
VLHDASIWKSVSVVPLAGVAEKQPTGAVFAGGVGLSPLHPPAITIAPRTLGNTPHHEHDFIPCLLPAVRRQANICASRCELFRQVSAKNNARDRNDRSSYLTTSNFFVRRMLEADTFRK